MKIGIVTLWQSSDNYGQQLQCYALQRYLIGLGHDVFLIRYDLDNRKNDVSLFLKIKKLIKKTIKLTPFYKYMSSYQIEIDRKNIAIKNEQRDFSKFRNEFLIQSECLYKNLSELRLNPPLADAYIAGSDQVWSFLLDNEQNKIFFLNFGDNKTKRISYAASFGMNEYPSHLINKLKDQLHLFNSISVREYNGIGICKQLGYEATKVIDPTLLLAASDYDNLTRNICSKSNYIFIYSLNISNSSEIRWQELKEYANIKSKKIIVTPASGITLGKELFPKECVSYEYSTIPQWIINIREASLVVTTSFHGIVFCILNHTNFVYVPLSGKYGRGNNRIIDLLNDLTLSSKILDKEKSYNQIADNPVNWNSVDSLLSKLKKESSSFLIKSLVSVHS